MRYSNGVVSRMLSMTTVALHSFEKESIIDTPKEESERRYYEKVVINGASARRSTSRWTWRCGTSPAS